LFQPQQWDRQTITQPNSSQGPAMRMMCYDADGKHGVGSVLMLEIAGRLRPTFDRNVENDTTGKGQFHAIRSTESLC
jgi:hypothetical protein